MTERTRWRLILAGAFLLPMAAVKAAAWYLSDAGPQVVTATPSVSDADSAIVQLLAASHVSETLSDEQERVFAYLGQLRERPIERSPLMKPTALPVDDSPPMVVLPAAPPELNAQVQAVMRTGAANLVMIGGKTYRVGDRIDDRSGTGGTWVIRKIDHVSGSVTFEHSSGRATETRSVLR
jgi:hypothetical protein